MGNRNRGLYGKFIVKRADGTHRPGEKHDGCDYFVLDLTHDPFAVEALAAYASACGREYPLLARDLRAKLQAMSKAAPAHASKERTVNGYPCPSSECPLCSGETCWTHDGGCECDVIARHTGAPVQEAASVQEGQ